MKVVKKVETNNSKLAMWRAAISLAHIDHKLTNSEVDLINDYIEHYSFSEEESKQLYSDLKKGVDINVVFPLITEKRDRANLINFARVLFHIDGDFSEVEKDILNKINKEHLLTIDLAAAFKAAKEAKIKFSELEKAEKLKEKTSSSFVEKAFDFLANID